MKICPACSREFSAERSRCPEDGVALVELRAGPSARPEELIGQTFDGRYRVERVIGRGGMGTVYACRHVVVGKLVAMKVLRAGVDRSEGVLQRFIREAQTANALRDRHIAEMSDFGQLPTGNFYVIMELLEGRDLAQLMKAGPVPAAELAHVFIQVAETLHRAHGKGVIHRDLKPDNIFLVTEGDDPLFVKLLDFGIAKVLHQDAAALTETGVILGTPYYMSPEQARAEQVDHRSDIYSLGVVMYRAFTGRLPFVADSTMGVLTRHLTEVPELPSRIHEVGPGVDPMVMRCLEKRPEDRFQSMQEVAATLRALTAPAGTGRARVVAPEAPPPDLAPNELTARSLALSQTGAREAAPPRRPVLLIGGAIVMALAGAAIALGVFARASAPAPSESAGAFPAAPPPSAPAAVVAAEPSAGPSAVPSTSADPSAGPDPSSSAGPASSSSAGPSATAAPANPRPPRVRPRPQDKQTPPSPTRRSEIRSPFDE